MVISLAMAGHAYALEQPEIIRELIVPTPDRAAVTIPAAGREVDRLRRIDLERGKSAVLRPEFDVRRVAVGDPKIADVVVISPREVHLVGKNLGDTNVVIWGTRRGLEAALDVHVGTPHSHLQGELRRVLENDTLEVDGAGGAVVLKGIVADPVQMERAVAVADAFFPERERAVEEVINLLEVGGNQQVMISVIIAEMNRTFRRNLATNLAGANTGGDNTFAIATFIGELTSLDIVETDAGLETVTNLTDRVNFVAAITRGSDQLDIAIEALQQKGVAKVLAEPTLVARSGEPAQFLVGGEVPIPIPQSGVSDAITIEFKEFGVAVSFTPTVMSAERIHLDVTTEVSQPSETFGIPIGGFVVPSFNTRRASTGVDLGDGQSFAIAGLLSENIDAVIQQFPILGDIPILGALFRSTSFRKDETELVLIVTPHLVKPLPPGPHTLPTDNYIEPNLAEFFLLGSTEGRVLDRLTGRQPTDPATLDDPERLRQERSMNPSLTDGVAGDAGHRVDISDAEEELR